MNRAKRTSKQAEKACAQLLEAKSQINELKTQLANAVEHKINALERARKIDELQHRIIDLENENSQLMAQIGTDKLRCRSTVDCSFEQRRRDEQTIQVRHFLAVVTLFCSSFFMFATQFFTLQTLRDGLAMLQSQLADTTHKLSQLQTFRTSVIRLLHLKDISHYSLLQRLQSLCHAQIECTSHL